MLTYTAIFLGAAVVAVPLFKRFGLGSVLGYLAAGMIIGPSGIGLVQHVEETLHVAELGVVLLLFIIGLELQPSRLWKMRNAVFGLGGAQVFASTAIAAGIARAFNVDWPAAIVIGFALAMSSTAFATQILAEKNELGTPHGRSAFAILLFQDLVAIPLLAIVPSLGTSVAAHKHPAQIQALLVVLVVVLLVFSGRFLLRPAFRFVAQARSHELSTASALLVVVGTAMLMQTVGLSMALGSFMAGVLLADSEYRHELESNIEPFKGLLLGLFFIAVGMSANLTILLEKPLVVFALIAALVAFKALVLYLVARVSKHPKRAALGLAASISQGGEFAFVIFGVASSAGIITSEVTELLIVVVTLSMVLTPLLFVIRDTIQKRFDAAQEQRPYDEIPDEGSRVIIAGFGRFGQIVARVLRLKRIPFTALDVNPTQVDFVRRFGNKIYYGDASRVDLLRAARAEHAQIFVLAIDDPEASMRTLKVVQEHFPHLKIVARARNRQHAYALLGAEVEIVIRETLASSIEAARVTLEELGLPASEARDTVKRFAQYDEEMVRKSFALRNDEKALIEAAKQYSEELERIFMQDASSS